MQKINELIKHFGTQTALANKLDVTPQTVQQWVANKSIPAKRCVQIEILTNGLFSRQELMPSIFGNLSKST